MKRNRLIRTIAAQRGQDPRGPELVVRRGRCEDQLSVGVRPLHSVVLDAQNVCVGGWIRPAQPVPILVRLVPALPVRYAPSEVLDHLLDVVCVGPFSTRIGWAIDGVVGCHAARAARLGAAQLAEHPDAARAELVHPAIVEAEIEASLLVEGYLPIETHPARV